MQLNKVVYRTEDWKTATVGTQAEDYISVSEPWTRLFLFQFWQQMFFLGLQSFTKMSL